MRVASGSINGGDLPVHKIIDVVPRNLQCGLVIRFPCVGPPSSADECGQFIQGEDGYGIEVGSSFEQRFQ